VYKFIRHLKFSDKLKLLDNTHRFCFRNTICN